MYQREVSPMGHQNKQKPIVSFKVSSPTIEKRPVSQNNQVDGCSFQIQNYLSVKIPKTISQKQNIVIPKPVETFAYRMTSQSQQCFRDWGSIEKAKSQEIQGKLSDKIIKQPKKIVLNKCQTCQNEEQSYIVLNHDLRCCSNCAIQQMKNGKQVKSLSSKELTENPVNQSLPRFRSLTLNPLPLPQEQDSLLIERIQRNCEELLEMIERKLHEERGVRDSFVDKRSQLKLHYERIKEAIQVAIHQDLENLRLQQEREIRQVKIRKQKDQKSVQQLSLIKKRMKEMRGTKRENFPEQGQNRVNAQLRNHLQKIEQILQKQSESKESLSFTIKKELYRPESFMAIGRADEKMFEWQDYSSLSTSEDLGKM